MKNDDFGFALLKLLGIDPADDITSLMINVSFVGDSVTRICVNRLATERDIEAMEAAGYMFQTGETVSIVYNGAKNVKT